MKKTATTTNTITATINGVVFEGLSLEQAKTLASFASLEDKKAEQPAKAEQPKKAAKPAKVEEKKPKYDAILDTKRVERMAQTAVERAKAQGFECSYYKRGTWIWMQSKDGKGRTPEFKSMKLAKGWKYSPKRGAFYRDFKEC